MAAFYFWCDTCDVQVRKYLNKTPVDEVCPTCNSPLRRTVQAASTRVVEMLDNGVMRRSVERLSDAERLFKDRSKQGSSQ